MRSIDGNTYDVIIVGGSYAGLAAAIQLGRARREVLIIDAGQRRNRFVSRAHGILGHDGESPAALAAKGKAEALAYPTVHWRAGTVADVRAVDGGFAVTAKSEALVARRLILATGVVDDIPTIPGVRERWGRTVFHCPYCDGYELERGRLGVLAAGPIAAHYAAIVAEWSQPGGTTLFLHGGRSPERDELTLLAAHGVHVDTSAVVEARDASAGIELVTAAGLRYQLAGLFVAPRTHVPGDFAHQLGCAVESGPTGSAYKTDPRTKETTVRGVYAAGDVAAAMHSVSYAIADGARAGAFAHQSLVFDR